MEHLQQPRTEDSRDVARARVRLQLDDQPSGTSPQGTHSKFDHTVSLPGWRTDPSHPAAPAPHPPFHRSEAFAEDLVEPANTLPMHPPLRRRRATLLFVVPLGAAFLGSVLPLLNQLA